MNIFDLSMELLQYSSKQGIFDKHKDVKKLVQCLITIKSIQRGGHKTKANDKYIAIFENGEQCTYILKQLLNDEAVNNKMIRNWIEELFMTLCELADVSPRKTDKIKYKSLGDSLLKIDTKQDKKGIDLYCYLLMLKGLPISFSLLLRDRIKNGDYKLVKNNTLWLEYYIQEIIKLDDNYEENTLFIASKALHLKLNNNSIKVILELLKNECQNMQNQLDQMQDGNLKVDIFQFGLSCKLFYDTIMKIRNNETIKSAQETRLSSQMFQIR